MRTMSRRLGCALLLALFLVGCLPTPTPVPAVPAATLVPTSTASPTLEPQTPTVAITAEPTATPTEPTATPTEQRTSTPMPSPTATLEPALAWVDTLRPYLLPGPGRAPSAIAVMGDRVYVANRASDNVSVIEEGRVVVIVPVGSQPVALATDPASGLVFVANLGEDSISVVRNDQVVATWDTGAEPSALALVAGRLYAASRRTPSIYIHDAETGEPAGTIDLGTGPGILNLAANASLGRLYLSAYHQVHIVDLETQSLIDSVGYENYATLAINAANGRVYINDYDPDEGQEYLVALEEDARTARGAVAIDPDPGQATVNLQTGRVYVTSTWADTLTVIDGESNQLVSVVGVGRQPNAVVVDPDANLVYVANTGSNNVAVVDGQADQVIRVIPLAVDIGGMAVDSRLDRLFATMTSMDRLMTWEAGTPVGEVAVGRHPVGVALNETTGLVYVVNHVHASLSVVDGASLDVVTTVPLSGRPEGVSVDAERNVIYAGDSVIDGESNQVIARIGVPTAYHIDMPPVDTVTDPVSGRLLVRASNGVPGSNAGLVISLWDSETLEMLSTPLGGLSAGAMVLDPSSQKLYSVATRFSVAWLHVDDLEGSEREMEMRLDRYPMDLALRVSTHHLFLGLGELLPPAEGSGNVLRVLDTRTLGQVAELAFPGVIAHIAVNQQTGLVYVADRDDGAIHVVQDRLVATPPTPTSVTTVAP